MLSFRYKADFLAFSSLCGLLPEAIGWKRLLFSLYRFQNLSNLRILTRQSLADNCSIADDFINSADKEKIAHFRERLLREAFTLSQTC